MQIVPVTRERFAVWKQLRAALYSDLDDDFHDREMEAIFASPEQACFLLESDAGEAIGLLELSLRNVVDGCLGGPVGYIEGMFVGSAWRGQGIGRQLLAHAEAWCAARGCREIATDAELENAAAQQFFQRLGFAETWRIVEFKKTLAPP